MKNKTYHKVTLDELELARQTFLDRVPGGTGNLVVVVIEARDVGISELGNLPSGSTDTAANVQNLHARLDADLRRQEVLMARNGLVEGLAGRIPAEVEALAPAVLVQVGREIVVAVRRSRSETVLRG